MKNKKQFDKFINDLIKKNKIIADIDLQNLFKEMTSEEINLLWYSYFSLKNISETNKKIPEWRTKDQLNYLLDKTRSYEFISKNKDTNDSSKKDRDDLINHIKFHLINIINEEIKSNIAFKNLPILKKISYYVIISRFAVIPFLIIFSILEKYEFCFIMVVICTSIFMLSFILHPIIEIISGFRSKE
jgi:hypothetical protein